MLRRSFDRSIGVGLKLSKTNNGARRTLGLEVHVSRAKPVLISADITQRRVPLRNARFWSADRLPFINFPDACAIGSWPVYFPPADRENVLNVEGIYMILVVGCARGSRVRRCAAINGCRWWQLDRPRTWWVRFETPWDEVIIVIDKLNGSFLLSSFLFLLLKWGNLLAENFDSKKEDRVLTSVC